MGNVCGTSSDAADLPSKPTAVTEPAADSAAPAVTEQAAAATSAPPAAEAQGDASSSVEKNADDVTAAEPKKVKIFVVFYSTYGHIHKLAEAYKASLETVEGLEVSLYQVAETLPADVLEKMHAPPKPDVPTIDAHKLPEADAFVFGFPTRFGMMCSQMKNLFDATGMLWQNGALHGKPASIFTSTASQGGGQETTIMTAVTQLAHHGMIFVPGGYAAGTSVFDVNTARGGSPWGAGTLAGPDGSREPTEVELEMTRSQAKNFGEIAKKLVA